MKAEMLLYTKILFNIKTTRISKKKTHEQPLTSHSSVWHQYIVLDRKRSFLLLFSHLYGGGIKV